VSTSTAIIGAPRKPISRSDAGQYRRFDRGERLPPDWNQLRVTDQYLSGACPGSATWLRSFRNLIDCWALRAGSQFALPGVTAAPHRGSALPYRKPRGVKSAQATAIVISESCFRLRTSISAPIDEPIGPMLLRVRWLRRTTLFCLGCLHLDRQHYSQWQDTSDESDETDCLDLLTHDAYPCSDQITKFPLSNHQVKTCQGPTGSVA
jgi:hypothetical protein